MSDREPLACVSDNGKAPHAPRRNPLTPRSVIASDSQKRNDQMGDVTGIVDPSSQAILETVRNEGWAVLHSVSDPGGILGPAWKERSRDGRLPALESIHQDLTLPMKLGRVLHSVGKPVIVCPQDSVVRNPPERWTSGGGYEADSQVQRVDTILLAGDRTKSWVFRYLPESHKGTIGDRKSYIAHGSDALLVHPLLQWCITPIDESFFPISTLTLFIVGDFKKVRVEEIGLIKDEIRERLLQIKERNCKEVIVQGMAQIQWLPAAASGPAS
ncbi:MAG: hypothetical protein M1840_000834 [Geoglossum simile]|nr:MAG: hypothetical protein M1840_000834 [Geoglossum simile]